MDGAADAQWGNAHRVAEALARRASALAGKKFAPPALEVGKLIQSKGLKED